MNLLHRMNVLPGRWPSRALLVALALVAGCGPQVEPSEATSAGDTAAVTFTSPIVGVQSQRCVDISGRSTTNGAQAQLWDCNGGTNQSFAYGTSKALVVYGNKCLQPSGGGTANGTAVVIGDCTGQASQQWNVNSDGTITSVPSGLCMDANGAATANGTKIIIWTCGTGSNQRWTVTGTTTTTYALNVAASGAGAGTVTSTPSGISCGSTCSASYSAGTSVTLTATAASGSTFNSWSGACSGTAATCVVAMNAAQSATAAFDLASTPSGTVSINAGGAATGAFLADASYSGGSTYSTTAAIDTSLLSGSVPPQAVFQTERYGEFTYTIANRQPGSAQTVTLYFSESYWTAAGQRTFNVAVNGATVLTAFDIFAAAGGTNRAVARTFNTSADASGQVVIAFTKGGGPDNPKVCGISVAGGAVNTFALGVSRAGSGSGSITSTPAGISCGSTCTASFASGTAVTLTAAAASGSTFAGWSGACVGSGACVVTLTTDQSVTANFNGSRPTTYANPVLWNDLADGDIIRVDDTYYYSASTMHYSPGAPVLRSYDMVNWEYAGHSVPSLDYGNNFSLVGGRAYVKGIWASFFNYRKSNKTFYWGGCIQGGGGTYVYTATAVDGTWTKHGPLPCYYDAGLLIDDNDTMYVAYGNTTISVAQLAADGFSQVRAQSVFTSPSDPGTIEGSRFYKRNGYYYIWVTRPANGQYVLRATSPWGPYTMRQVLLNMGSPVSGSGVPHQGGLVQTQAGDWYYMAFIDAYPGGRVPVLAPIDWVSDWPVIRTVNGAWGASYPFPNVPAAPRDVKPPTGTDTFSGSALGAEWEWNHNPDNSRWSVGSGLRLQTATVTGDLYSARNTLTHRILGPTSTGTIVLDYSAMKDGDRAGLALFRDLSAWVGVRRDSGATRVAFVNNINMDGSWNTSSTGTEVTSSPVSGGKIWLRIAADIRPGTGRQGRFSYSTDGVNFTQIGTYTMGNAWQFFMGYRYGIFNYATQSLGGAVTVSSFTLSTP